ELLAGSGAQNDLDRLPDAVSERGERERTRRIGYRKQRKTDRFTGFQDQSSLVSDCVGARPGKGRQIFTNGSHQKMRFRILRRIFSRTNAHTVMIGTLKPQSMLPFASDPFLTLFWKIPTSFLRRRSKTLFGTSNVTFGSSDFTFFKSGKGTGADGT